MRPVRALAAATRPLARWLAGVQRAAALDRAFARGEGDRTAALLARQTLLEIVDRVTAADAIEEADREMIHSVVELGETITREVMVPRTAMIVIVGNAPVRKAMSLFLRSGHSRVPVIGASEDDVTGVAYLKDAALALQRDPAAAGEPIGALARPAFFVPESKPVDDLLREMRARETHMAIVVDEFGGVAGLVTVEDVLEEIVGELVDEHDPDPPEAEELGAGRWRVPAVLPLDELGELVGRDIGDDAVDTVGGLLATALGRVPIVGSHAAIQGLELTAERAEGRRKQIATILVRDLGPDS